MNPKLITCVLSFFFINSLFSQHKEVVDSILRVSVKIVDLSKALSKADEAFKIAKSINYEEGVLKSELAKIVIYCDHLENKESMERIERIEPEILASNNNTLIAHLKQMKGRVYGRLNLRSEAQEELNSALLYSQKIIDDDQRHYRKGKVYYALAILNDDARIKNYYSIVWRYLKLSYQESSLVKDNHYRDGLITTCIALGSGYVGKKDFTSANFYLKKAMKISQQVKCVTCESYALNRVGYMYYSMNDKTNAVKNYERSIEISDSIGNYGMLKVNYQEVLVIYEKLKDEEKIKQTLRNIKHLSDTLDNNNNLALRSAVKSITNNVDSKHKQNISYLKLYLTIGGVLCLLLVYMILRYLKKYRAEKENRDKLEKDLIEKTSFIQSLNSSKSIIEKDEELKAVIRMAIKNDVLFFQAFNELFPDFRQKLLKLDPLFRIVDLKFCCYLKLNFDTKEIARYTGNSVRSVESKKYRLRKKIGISSQEDINAWFFNL